MLRSFLALSLVVPAPAATWLVPPKAVVQVICPMPGGWSAGTAFRVGKYLLTVNHVTKPGTCEIGGVPVKVLYASPTKDFAILAGDEGPFIPVDCGGFVQGKKYLAIGYARGLPFQTKVELVATGQKSGQFSILRGVITVIPGQSGGPIVDADTGRVVGTVNVYNFEQGWSGSVALADTPICAAKA
jgi:hypothetical protein